MWAIVFRSLIWTLFSVVLQVNVGLVMALFLNQVFLGRAFFRGLFLLPWVIPVVVVAVIWKWILNDLYGVASDVLTYVFPPWAHLAWFSDPMLALPTLIAINVWRGSPFTMVILLAGLQTVPRDQLEAARIDGANNIQQFRHVTIPHLRKILLIVMLAASRTRSGANARWRSLFATTRPRRRRPRMRSRPMSAGLWTRASFRNTASRKPFCSSISSTARAWARSTRSSFERVTRRTSSRAVVCRDDEPAKVRPF